MSTDTRHTLREQTLIVQNREYRKEIARLEARQIEVHAHTTRLSIHCERLQLLAIKLRAELTNERALLQSCLHERALAEEVEPKTYKARWLEAHSFGKDDDEDVPRRKKK